MDQIRPDKIINNSEADLWWRNSHRYSVEQYGIREETLFLVGVLCPTMLGCEISIAAEKFSGFMALYGEFIENPASFFIVLCQKAYSGEKILPEIESEIDCLNREMAIRTQKVHKDRAETEEQLLKVSFQEWIGSLSSTEKLEIAPSSTFVKEGSHPHTQQFKNHYRANLWPAEMEKIVINTNQGKRNE